MIWHANAKPWTKAEKARADRMAAEIGCIFCWLEDGQRGPCDHRHHIISGNKRIGHWYTLPCCTRHHGDCHNGTFNHAKQIDTWLKVQHALDLSDELPKSKILPRRLSASGSEATRVTENT